MISININTAHWILLLNAIKVILCRILKCLFINNTIPHQTKIRLTYESISVKIVFSVPSGILPCLIKKIRFLLYLLCYIIYQLLNNTFSGPIMNTVPTFKQLSSDLSIIAATLTQHIGTHLHLSSFHIIHD